MTIHLPKKDKDTNGLCTSAPQHQGYDACYKGKAKYLQTTLIASTPNREGFQRLQIRLSDLDLNILIFISSIGQGKNIS